MSSRGTHFVLSFPPRFAGGPLPWLRLRLLLLLARKRKQVPSSLALASVHGAADGHASLTSSSVPPLPQGPCTHPREFAFLFDILEIILNIL